MKRKSKLTHKTLNLLCSLMVVLAPAIVENVASGLLWGEPEYPKFK
jgi:hypothetical protein